MSAGVGAVRSGVRPAADPADPTEPGDPGDPADPDGLADPAAVPREPSAGNSCSGPV